LLSKLSRPKRILIIGSLWSLCNLIFALYLGSLIDLHSIQYYGLIYLVQQSERAIAQLSAYLLFTFVFFYAIISRFHHARKRGRVIAESFFIFVISLIVQGIVHACAYPSTEAIAGDATAPVSFRPVDLRFFLLVVLGSISHLALIATVTASVWQRKWHANNVNIHLLIGLSTTLLLIMLSLPPALIDLGDASWLFYCWFASLPLTFAMSCATELRPPYLLKLPTS
jgi:hypothetical protein